MTLTSFGNVNMSVCHKVDIKEPIHIKSHFQHERHINSYISLSLEKVSY